MRGHEFATKVRQDVHKKKRSQDLHNIFTIFYYDVLCLSKNKDPASSFVISNACGHEFATRSDKTFTTRKGHKTFTRHKVTRRLHIAFIMS